MGRQDALQDLLATPGAGPSAPPKDETHPKPNIVAQRENLLGVRRRQVAQVLEHHDDLIREAFHLEHFTTLVHYDPMEAKLDRSSVFEAYRAKYDLLRNAPQDTKSPRKTRGAAQDLRQELIVPKSSTSRHKPSETSAKGKGRNRFLPPSVPPNQTVPRPPNVPRRPQVSSKSVAQHRYIPTTPSTSVSRPVPPSPRTPTRIRIIRPPTTDNPLGASPSNNFNANRSLRSTAPYPKEVPDGPVDRKHKAEDSPSDSPRLLKRLKLVHKPRLEVSDPFQLPPPPLFRGSLSSLLDSYFYIDDEESTVSKNDLEDMAKATARTRNRIEELRISGVFADHERKMDTTPPVEPKRLPDHYDHLIAHAVQLSKIFRENHRATRAGARRVAKLVEKHFERVAGAEERAQKAEEKRQGILVKLTLREIVNQWKLAIKFVRARMKDADKAEQVRRGKEHLDAFLQQSTQVLEAQHNELTVGRNRTRSASRSSRGVRSNSEASGSRRSSVVPGDGGPSSEAESGYDEIPAIATPDTDSLVADDQGMETFGLHRGEVFDFDFSLSNRAFNQEEWEETIPRHRAMSSSAHSEIGLYNDFEVDNPPALRPITPSEDGSTDHYPGLEPPWARGLSIDSDAQPETSTNPPVSSHPSSYHSPVGASAALDDEFQHEEDGHDVDDAQFDEEMDAEGGESDEGEINGLQDDGNVPIDELLRRYGYPIPEGSQELSEPQDDSIEANHGRVKVLSPEPNVLHNTPQLPVADDEFIIAENSVADDADRQMEIEMEEEEGSDSDDSEVQGLAGDAEIPIQEVLRQYGIGLADPPLGTPTVQADDRPMVNGNGERKDSTTAVQVSPRSLLDDDSVRSSGVSSSLDGHPAIATESVFDDEQEVQDDLEEDEDGQGDDRSSISDTHLAISGLRDGADQDIAINPQIPPPFLLRGTLRPYQQAGLEWLASLYTNNINGILADEMGLGKTIQTIALLGWLACSRGQWGPHLVIVPTSVLLNWEMEFKRFLPGFKTLAYYGNQKERREKRQGWNSPNAFNVCITSYQLALADQTIFRRKKWVYMILDEAHNIKNFKSKRWETLLCFNAQHRLLLTGTPLQNNLMELWSLLYFLMPDEGFARDTEDAQLFVRRQDFKDLFQNPVERAIENGDSMTEETKDTVQKLHTLLRPYLLRRLKSEVEKELPSKFEHLVYCRLSKRQRFLYDEFMSRAATRETLSSGNFLSIVNCLMQLRKVCNHPALFEVRPVVTSFAMSRSAVADYEIKEFLVRRRLLSDGEEKAADISFLGLQITQAEPVSLFALRSTSRLDASSRFPYVSELPGEPPPVDTRTISGWKAHSAYQARSATIGRWKHIAYINRSKCNKLSVYPSEVLRVFGNLIPPLFPLAIAAQDSRSYLSRVDIVHAMVKSYTERLNEVADQIDHFAFATPKVVALDLPSLTLSKHAIAAIHRETRNPDFDTLHRPAVKLQIAFPDASLIQFDCGKLQELDILLRQRAAGGHRVLIFTQMTKVLDILEIFLNLHGYRYLRLDGATKIEQRQIITERFNVDQRIFAFIASSRSGGVGINLTGADTVIFYDSDYNPSMDRQCEDRAHRIGQTREVHIYRFISSYTVEEAMLRKANQKRSLDDMVIQKGEFDWRKMLADELDGAGGKKLEEALAVVEDTEDAEAAKVATAEIVSDQIEFREMDGVADPVGAEEPEVVAVEEEDEPDVGTVAEYMIRMVERDWEFFGFERPYGTR